MKKWKIDPLEVLICALTGVILVCIVLAVGHCEASIEDCIDASCRVSVPLSGTTKNLGTGVCIVNSPDVYVLTNAHITEGRKKAFCEFWWRGVKGDPVEAEVIWSEYKQYVVDIALLRLPRAKFGQRPPKAIPLAPPDYVHPKGFPILTVGCARGAWASVMKGTTTGYSKEHPHLRIVPMIENGRSGSGVFDESGSYLLGLLFMNRDAQSTAQYVNVLHHKLGPLQPEMAETRLFRQGSICDRLRPQGKQAETPPGTGEAYPMLPPLPGYGPQPSDLERALTDLEYDVVALREDLSAEQSALKELKEDLADKETRLQRIFGEDYGLMKQIAADAKAAKAAADETNEDVSAVAKTVTSVAKAVKEDIPTVIDTKIATAVAKIPQVDVATEVENKFGILRDSYAKLQLRIEKAQADGAEGVREVATSVVWGVIKGYGWPIGGILGVAFFLLWRRKQTGESLPERVRGAVSPLFDWAREKLDRDQEDGVIARAIDRFRPPAPVAPNVPPPAPPV